MIGLTVFGGLMLAQLSQFAGQQLAFAKYNLNRDGHLIPFGMTLDLSFWSGATQNFTMLVTDDPKTIPHIAMDWFMQNHKKAKFVGVAIDSYSIIDGNRTSAVIVNVRPADHSMRMLVFQPYTPGPILFSAPVIDFPPEHAALLARKDFALSKVLDGLQRSPLKITPVL